MNTSTSLPIGASIDRPVPAPRVQPAPVRPPGFLRILGVIGVILSTASSLSAAVLLKFDSAGDLETLKPASTNYPELTWSGTAGVGGGGGVLTQSGFTYGNYRYSGGVFDASEPGKTFSLSYYFLTPSSLPTSNGSQMASVGILKDAQTTTASAPTDFIDVRLIRYDPVSNGFAFAVNNSTTSNSIFGDFSVSADTWYKMEGLFTQESNGQWTIEMNLWSYGSTGAGDPSLVTTVTRNPSGYSVYTGVGQSMDAVLMIGAVGASRQAAFDLMESNVVFIPEPGTALLMGLGVSAGLLAARYKSRK